MEILNIFGLPLPYSAIFLLATFLSAHGLSFSFFSVVCYSIQNKILGVALYEERGLVLLLIVANPVPRKVHDT